MSSAIAHHVSPALMNPFSAWVLKGLEFGLEVLTTLRAALKPRALTKFEEAEQLRAVAATLMDSEPSFASDLFAAADRHEFGQQAS